VLFLVDNTTTRKLELFEIPPLAVKDGSTVAYHIRRGLSRLAFPKSGDAFLTFLVKKVTTLQ
jgi:hypothetical protein